jgi:hypothetical protein
MKKLDLRTLNNAIEWLKIHNINGFISDEKIVILCGDYFELELSDDEIIFRSQLYMDSKHNNQ